MRLTDCTYDNKPIVTVPLGTEIRDDAIGAHGVIDSYDVVIITRGSVYMTEALFNRFNAKWERENVGSND